MMQDGDDTYPWDDEEDDDEDEFDFDLEVEMDDYVPGEDPYAGIDDGA